MSSTFVRTRNFFCKLSLSNRGIFLGIFVLLTLLPNFVFVFKIEISTAHTHTMETHSMEKVPSMENFSIDQTE